MPLAADCQEYLGRRLLILPYYGHGWNRQDLHAPPLSPIEVLGPEPFHVRVEDAFPSAGQLIGAGGIISEAKHSFDARWCVFCLREVGDFNFTDHAGHYIIWITASKPLVQPAPEKAVYEWVHFDKTSLCLCGYGMVAESAEWILDIYDRTMVSRKLVTQRQP